MRNNTSHAMRLCSGLVALCCCLLAAGCGGAAGGGASDAVVIPTATDNIEQPGQGNPLLDSLPPIPADDRQASVTALTLPGKDFYDSSPGVQVSGDRLILASSAGLLRWSMYRFTSTETAHYPVELRVAVGEGSEPYWLALADYGRGSWHFTGPFTQFGTLAVPAGSNFLSPQGYAYAVALTFDGDRAVIDELELVLSQYPPPPAPTGLGATVVPGSVRLDWDAVDTPGLVGYNVYFALSSFTLAEQFHVSRANLALVPAGAEPSFNLTELEADTVYFFRVAAVVGDQVESTLSNIASTNTNYVLSAGDVFPQRQYPGFWVYVEGQGFDPAPGATTVSLNNSPLDSGLVSVVDGTELRFRVPADTEPDETYQVRVHTGTNASNQIPLYVTNYATPPKTWAHVGQVLYQQYEMYEPYGVAVDEAGHSWVANAWARRVDGFNADGSPYKSVFMNDIRDIEVLADGRLLCKEGGGPHLWYYDPADGSIERAIDDAVVEAVLGDGEFVATTASGIIYISDEENGLIHKFVGGAFSLSIGAGILTDPHDVELDGAGNLIVADTTNDSLYWFSPSGTKLGEYSGAFDSEENTGELRDPQSVAVSGNIVYVADRERDRVLRFNNGNHGYIDEWGEGGFQDGSGTGLPDPAGQGAHFWSLWGIAVAGDGSIMVSDNFNMRVGFYRAADGLFLRGLGDYIPDAGEFAYPLALTVNPLNGAYAVLDRAAFTVTVYDRENVLQNAVYLETADESEGDVFTGRMGRHGQSICWSSNGRLYFTHAYNKLTEYTEDFSAYRLLAYDWGEEPTEFKGAYALCEYAGDLYVSDRENARIQVFNGLGQYERNILMPNQVDQRPDRVAYDSDHGWLYVLDRAWNDQSLVHRFNAATGAYIDSLDPGYGLGAALAVDPVGHIYVYHWADGFLLERWAPPDTPGGAYTLVDRFLSYGDGDGEVRDISWLTVSADGRYFICDRNRQQVVILAP